MPESKPDALGCRTGCIPCFVGTTRRCWYRHRPKGGEPGCGNRGGGRLFVLYAEAALLYDVGNDNRWLWRPAGPFRAAEGGIINLGAHSAGDTVVVEWVYGDGELVLDGLAGGKPARRISWKPAARRGAAGGGVGNYPTAPLRCRCLPSRTACCFCPSLPRELGGNCKWCPGPNRGDTAGLFCCAAARRAKRGTFAIPGCAARGQRVAVGAICLVLCAAWGGYTVVQTRKKRKEV